MEERNRLFLGLIDRHTSQSQHREGIPVDVPDPRNSIFIIFKGKMRSLGVAEFFSLSQFDFLS